MPIPPKPFMLQCPACGWKKVYRPTSDVLWYSRTCARCDTPIKTRRLTSLEQAVETVLHPFGN